MISRTFSIAAAASLITLIAAPAFALPGGTPALPPKFDAMPAASADPALEAAVQGPQRTPALVARDVARHPVETLTFWGLKPGQTVIELVPGGGYWTEILAPYAYKTKGRYIATAADLKDSTVSEAARAARAGFAAKYANQDIYGRVELVDFGPKSGPLAAPGTVDLVITARNIHNWIIVPGRVEKVMADAFAALKPGGYLGVEDHRADPRREVNGGTDGYLSEASVIAAATKAGFVLDAKSQINANPKDTKDHPFGVWTLPPERRTSPLGQPANPAFDRSKYDAIGESDRMTLRFRKPG